MCRGHEPVAAPGWGLRRAPGCGRSLAPALPCPAGSRHPNPLSRQTREHLAKAQRGLPGEGVSEVIQTLVEISQDGTSYSGDLLSTIDVLRNMTEIFRRAYYSPTPGDVQVGPGRAAQEGTPGGPGPGQGPNPVEPRRRPCPPPRRARPGPGRSPIPGSCHRRSPGRGALSSAHGPPSCACQNFVQIISNLLAEENRDKWEEAQLVRTPAWAAQRPRHPQVRAGPGGGGLDSNASPASPGHVTPRKLPLQASASHPRDRSSGRGGGEGPCPLHGSRQGDQTQWFFLIWK